MQQQQIPKSHDKSERGKCVWYHPQKGQVIINFDGASWGNLGVADIDCCIRNSKADILIECCKLIVFASRY